MAPIDKAMPQNRILVHFPGFVLVVVIAMAASFISDHYGGPVLLYALLLGVAMGALSEEKRFTYGLNFGAEKCLPIGIALAGLGVTFTEIAALGSSTVAITLGVLASTLLIGLVGGKLLGEDLPRTGIFSASVAICGGAAALAVASLFPKNERARNDAALAIIIVTTLSTAAMILYPAIAAVFDLTETQTGIFLGATIHAVGQAVASGYSVSETTGEAATLVKLLRVACLVPVVFVFSTYLRRAHKRAEAVNSPRPALIPFFMIGFSALVIIANLVELPASIITVGAIASKTLILLAVSAIGVQSSIRTLIQVGLRPLMMLTGLTLFMATLCLLLLRSI